MTIVYLGSGSRWVSRALLMTVIDLGSRRGWIRRWSWLVDRSLLMTVIDLRHRSLTRLLLFTVSLNIRRMSWHRHRLNNSPCDDMFSDNGRCSNNGSRLVHRVMNNRRSDTNLGFCHIVIHRGCLVTSMGRSDRVIDWSNNGAILNNRPNNGRRRCDGGQRSPSHRLIVVHRSCHGIYDRRKRNRLRWRTDRTVFHIRLDTARRRSWH